MLLRYVLAMALGGLQAPPRDSLLAQGIRLAPMEPAAALVRFEGMLARDSTDVVANWRAAIALNDIAQPLVAKGNRPRRDSLLARGEDDARRAVRLAPHDARALFSLGLVLGNTALTRSIKPKIRMAVEIRDLAVRALAADSTHDGAQHLLGRWNYEVMKLSGFERFVAKRLLGAGVFREASWAEARTHLERAVALDPARIYHRLDLARVCLERGDSAAAGVELRRIAELTNRFAADTTYRREAAELLRKLDQSRR